VDGAPRGLAREGQRPARRGTRFAEKKAVAGLSALSGDGDHKVGKPSSARTQAFGGRAEELTAKAQKLRRKGELRRAAVTLREACALDESNAARWALLGDVLFRMAKKEEAADALKQAVYLREQAGEKSKATVVRRLILNLARLPRR
jgi:cytochrome c-type biogenesis protein CcmH/NrfG